MKMIKYIVNNKDGCAIVAQEYLQSDKSNFAFIKQRCLEHLITYHGYQEALAKTLNYHRKNPIVLNKSEIYFQSNSPRKYQNIWINYQAIINVSFAEKQLEITFYDDEKMTVNLSKYQYCKLEEKIAVIRKQLNW